MWRSDEFSELLTSYWIREGITNPYVNPRDVTPVGALQNKGRNSAPFKCICLLK